MPLILADVIGHGRLSLCVNPDPWFVVLRLRFEFFDVFDVLAY